MLTGRILLASLLAFSVVCVGTSEAFADDSDKVDINKQQFSRSWYLENFADVVALTDYGDYADLYLENTSAGWNDKLAWKIKAYVEGAGAGTCDVIESGGTIRTRNGVEVSSSNSAAAVALRSWVDYCNVLSGGTGTSTSYSDDNLTGYENNQNSNGGTSDTNTDVAATIHTYWFLRHKVDGKWVYEYTVGTWSLTNTVINVLRTYNMTHEGYEYFAIGGNTYNNAANGGCTLVAFKDVPEQFVSQTRSYCFGMVSDYEYRMSGNGSWNINASNCDSEGFYSGSTSKNYYGNVFGSPNSGGNVMLDDCTITAIDTVYQDRAVVSAGCTYAFGFITDVIHVTSDGLHVVDPSNGNEYNSTTYNNYYNTYPTNTTYDTTNNYMTQYNYVYDEENNITGMSVDLSPITLRLDALNTMVGQLGLDVQSIGTDIRTLDSDLKSGLSDIYDRIGNLGDWLGGKFDTLFSWLSRIYARLGVVDADVGSVTGVLLDIERDLQGLDLSPEVTVEGGGGSTDVSGIESLLTQIRDDMANLDRSTGDLVDVSTIETRLGGILTDFDNLLLVLEDWPDYPTMPGIDLSEITDELSEWHNDFIGMWDGFGLSFDRVNHNLEDILDKLRDWGQPSYPTHPEQGDKTIGELTFDKMKELKKKFPFSIPWDIAAMIDLFVAPPKAPVFELPVPLTDEVVQVDMSPLEPVAQVTRRGSLLLFGFALMWSTKRLIWGGPEGV